MQTCDGGDIKTTQTRTAKASARSECAPQASLAFGGLWHNESTVKTTSRPSATLSISTVILTCKDRVVTRRKDKNADLG